MCAIFTVRATQKQLMEQLQMEPLTADQVIEGRFMPYSRALVAISKDHELELVPMQFSMVPSWAKESKVKFATHNARLETITDKPTWKKPFKSHHCGIPMSTFVEPIYEGKMAGNMVEFIPNKNEILWAAGVFDTWINKESGEILESFAVITSDPPNFVKNTGHDRCPLFLSPQKMKSWLDSENQDPEKLKIFLTQSKLEPDLEAQIDRPLKPGWEKRR